MVCVYMPVPGGSLWTAQWRRWNPEGEGREAERRGDADGGIWSAGQVIGLIDDIPTVKELMDRLVRETEEAACSRLGSLVTPPSRL